MSSAKRLFLVGALLGMPVSFTGCNQADPKITEELKRQLEEKQQEADQANANSLALKSQMTALKSELDRAKEKSNLPEGAKTAYPEANSSAHSNEEAAKLREQLRELSRQFEEYKSKYKVSIRQRASGLKLEDFSAGGRKYTGVSVRALDDTSVSILHNEGLAKLDAASLPDQVATMLAFRQPELTSVSRSWGTPKKPAARSNLANLSSSPKNKPGTESAINDAVNTSDVIRHAVVMIEGTGTGDEVNVTGKFSSGLGHGSGFIVNIGNASFLYTNIHVLSGMRSLKIRTMSGEEIKDLEYLEASDEAAIGDVARYKLVNRRELAFRFPQVSQDPKVGLAVAAYGDSGGESAVTILEGELLAVGPEKVETSAGIIQGNSGGPLVEANSDVVVGINSFISHETAQQGEAITSGTRFSQGRRFSYRAERIAKWRRLPLDGLALESERIQQIGRDTTTLKVVTKLEGIISRRGFWGPNQDSLIRTIRDDLNRTGGGNTASTLTAAMATVNQKLQRGVVRTKKTEKGASVFYDDPEYGPGAPVAAVEVAKIYEEFFATVFTLLAKDVKGVTSQDYTPFHYETAIGSSFKKAEVQRLQLASQIRSFYERVRSANWQNER